MCARSRVGVRVPLLALLVCAGCAGVPFLNAVPQGGALLPERLVETHPASWPAGDLAAASDPSPDIAWPAPPDPAEMKRDEGREFSARLGYMVPVAESQDEYPASPVFGAYYSGQIRTFGYEAGLDLTRLESADGNVSASFRLLRLDCLLSRWRPWSERPEVYGLGGYQVVSSDAAGGEMASALNLGFGVISMERTWDARFTYSFLIGSDNIQGLLLLTGGYRF